MNEEDCKGISATWTKPKYDFIFQGGDGSVLLTGNAEVLAFSIGGIEVLNFARDGKVTVRGELVDDNVAVYKTLLDWLKTMGFGYNL